MSGHNSITIMNQINPYAPPKSPVADSPLVENAPALWNPRAASNWSLLFTPAFGAFIHMKNWEALGESRKASASKAWAIGTITFLLVMALSGVVFGESKTLDILSRPLGLALLVSWYFASGRPHQLYVHERFGNTYERRGWFKPLGLAVLALFGLMVVGGILGAILGAVGLAG